MPKEHEQQEERRHGRAIGQPDQALRGMRGAEAVLEMRFKEALAREQEASGRAAPLRARIIQLVGKSKAAEYVKRAREAEATRAAHDTATHANPLTRRKPPA